MPGPYVFVVDDEVLVLTLVKDFLEEEGLQVRTFNCPEKALTALGGDDDKPVLLISDFTMPKFNGGELIRRALKLLPELKTLLISGKLTLKDFEIARISADMFLAKPFDLNELLGYVKRLLKE